MALINHAKGEINAKLVYVGPASAGKSTNLHYIYGKLKESFRGTFKSMNLQNDKMLFFDFLPSEQGQVNGYKVRFHLYTLTGEISHAASWKMVLKGADGLVFVADSAPDRMAANLESLDNVNSALAAYGKNIRSMPCIVQCNKRDVPQALDLEGMGHALNPGNYSSQIAAVAGKGEGVLDTIFALVKQVLQTLRADGLELQGEAEQFRRMTESVEPARHELPSAGEGLPGGEAAEPGGPIPTTGAAGTSAVDEEPTVRFAGEAELLETGEIRLPLSIEYSGKMKRMTLNISLSPPRE